MRTNIFITLLLVVLAAGCAVGPDYHPPKAETPASFTEMTNGVNTNKPVSDWWHSFHDPELDRLIELALKENLDLQMAAMRIREARFQRNIAAADLFPVVNADGSYAHTRGSENVVLPLGGSGSGGSSGVQQSGSSTARPAAVSSSGSGGSSGGSVVNSPSLAPSPLGQGGLPGVTTDLYQVGFDASWEIDIFGGQRRRVEAASADFEASRQRRHDLQVMIAAEVARDYLELRGTQERLQIARDNLKAENDILGLIRSRRDAGLATDLDVTRAAAEADRTAATIPPLEALAKSLVHSLSTLLAKEPGALAEELNAVAPLPPVPPDVPIGLPSQLIRRRADIRAAEREIAAANARIGAAEADMFPKFDLIGSTGLDASSAANLFDWGSRYFLISPTVTWRIFDAGRVMGNIRLQRATKQEAELQYRETILNALSEVENALVNYATEQARHNHLADALHENQEALRLARDQYEKGLADFLTVLDVERSLLSAQDAYSQSSQSVSTDLVAIYKSLGGGWD